MCKVSEDPGQRWRGSGHTSFTEGRSLNMDWPDRVYMCLISNKTQAAAAAAAAKKRLR